MNKTFCHLLLLPVTVFVISAGPATAPVPSERARAERLVRQLDDPDALVRRRAALQLNSLGGEALPVVEAAAKQDDLSPESRARLTTALHYLRPRVKREAERLAHTRWEEAEFLKAYDGGGHTNAAYDELAHRAIRLYLQLVPDPQHADPELREQTMPAFRAASEKGCHDQLFESLFALAYGKPIGYGTVPAADMAQETVRQMQQGRYPPAVKVRVTVDYLRGSQNQFAAFVYRGLLKLLPEAAAEPGLPAGELEALATEYLRAEASSRNVANHWMEFYQAWKKAAPQGTGRLVLEARTQLALAEENMYRSGLLNNRDAWQSFASYTGAAERALDEAWKLDPADARVASLMVTVKWAQGPKHGGREGFETWFKRAMDLDPDNLEACNRKMIYLSPYWYGTRPELLEFGWDCLKTENWRAALPQILTRVHESLAEDAPDTKEYFERPEVWQDIAAVYEGAVINFPNVRNRCLLAKYAAKCGHWDVVREQLDRVGDHPALSVFVSKASYDYLRRKAARLGGGTTRPADGSR